LENIEVHALFAVDCSSSLTDGDFNVAMKFASNVTKFMGKIESTRPAKMGVIQFSTQVFTMVPLATPSNWTILARNLTFSHIHDRIRNKTLIAETNTEIALQHIGDLLDRERNKTLENDMGPTTVVSLAFVLTDGQTKHKMKLSEQAQRLHQLNVTVYSIGVGPECQAVSPQSSCVNTTELEIISGSENRTHHVDQFDELQDIMETVLVKVCDDLQSNLIQILTLSAAAIVGIVLLSIVGVLIVYGIQDVIRNRVLAAQLAADAEKLKHRQSVKVNPLYAGEQ